MVFRHWWAAFKSLSNCCPSICRARWLQMFLNSTLSCNEQQTGGKSERWWDIGCASLAWCPDFSPRTTLSILSYRRWLDQSWPNPTSGSMRSELIRNDKMTTPSQVTWPEIDRVTTPSQVTGQVQVITNATGPMATGLEERSSLWPGLLANIL